MATLSDLKKLERSRAIEIEKVVEKIETQVSTIQEAVIEVPKETLQSLFGEIAREKVAFERIKSSTITDFASILKESGAKSILKKEVSVEEVVETPSEVVGIVPEEVVESPVEAVVEPPKEDIVEQDSLSVSDLKDIIDDLKKSIKDFVVKTERELKSIKLSSGGYSSGGGGAVRLSELDDVDVMGASNNDVLTYSAASGKFIPKQPTIGGVEPDITAVAAESISQYDFVVSTLTGVYKATSLGFRDLNSTVYLAANQASVGGTVSLKYDTITNVPFGYIQGSRILLGVDGVGIENSQVAGTNFIKPIAMALTPTQIKILTEPSIIRNG